MSEQEVRQASDRFYQALNQMLGGDTSELEKVWSHGNNVSTMHPLGGSEVGWDQVLGGWKMATQAITSGEASVRDLRVFELGDVAYTTGVESAQAIVGGTSVEFEARCTNIYRKEHGEWKMVHHHSDLSPDAMKAVQKLMA